MRFADDPDTSDWRPDAGKAPGYSPPIIGLIVFGAGCLLLIYLFLPFETWFSRLWASLSPEQPASAPVAVAPSRDKDLDGLQQHHLPKPPPQPLVTPRAVEAAPVVNTPDTSLYDSLKGQIDGWERKYADLEAWITGQKAEPAKPTASKPPPPKVKVVDEDAKRRAEEAKKDREAMWKSKTIFQTRPKEDKVGQLHALKSPYSLAPSETIPCETTMEVSSDTPGAFILVVTEDIGDTATKTQNVLPKGSKAVVKPRRGLIFGDSRLDIQTQTLTFPGGSWLKMPASTLTDQAGTAGFTGPIDRHYGRIFGSILLTGVLRGGTTAIAGGYGGDAGQRMAGAVVQEGAAEGTKQARQMLRTDPTITVPNRYRCQWVLEDELVLTRSFGRLQP